MTLQSFVVHTFCLGVLAQPSSLGGFFRFFFWTRQNFHSDNWTHQRLVLVLVLVLVLGLGLVLVLVLF